MEYDNDHDEPNYDYSYNEIEESDTDSPSYGTHDKTHDLLDVDVLNTLASYMDVGAIRALARTSSGMWSTMKSVWYGNLMWKLKTEQLLGVRIPDTISYHDWEHIYYIVLDDNLPMLHRLKSPSTVRLGRMLGASTGRAGKIHLSKALEEKDVPLVAALLEDKTLDPENTLLLSYIKDNEGTRYGEQLKKIVAERY